MDQQRPTVGRIVHCANADERHLAGIVTEVRENGDIVVAVFNPEMRTVEWWVLGDYDEAFAPGTWHWPERT